MWTLFCNNFSKLFPIFEFGFVKQKIENFCRKFNFIITSQNRRSQRFHKKGTGIYIKNMWIMWIIQCISNFTPF